ncbi:MAG: type IV secretion system protein [Planctomycetaceae bacterium]|nr:type IV secretion system protein [Planctomycetaceae bacterium]
MIETIINNVDSIILAFVQGAFGSLTPIVQILWRLMFIIFIAVFGYKVIISGRFAVNDLIVNTLKIIILLLIATEWDTFFLLVYNMATDLPSDIAGQIMTGAANATPGAVASDDTSANLILSNFYDRALVVVTQILEGARWYEVGKYFYAFIIWFGALALSGYAAMLIVLSKIAVAILLSIGPLFILLLIFANTRSLFEGWLRTLLNYAVIPIFVYALLALLLTISDPPLVSLENNTTGSSNTLSYIGAFIFVSFVSVLLLMQVMNIAASITGGLSLSTMGSASWGARTAGRLGKGTPKGAFTSGVFAYNAARHPVQSSKAIGKRLATSAKKIRGF